MGQCDNAFNEVAVQAFLDGKIPIHRDCASSVRKGNKQSPFYENLAWKIF